MNSKLFSFKLFALFGLVTMFFMANGFAQNNSNSNDCDKAVKVTMMESSNTTEDMKDKEPTVIISSSYITPTKDKPEEKTVQAVEVSITENSFNTKNELEIKDESTPYYTVSEMPVYVDGKRELPLYVMQTTRYPAEAQKDKPQGVVVVQVVVEKDGSITNPQVIAPVHPLLDEEALRVVSTLKSFSPGKQNGEAVRCYYQIPVPFIVCPKD